MNKKDVKKKKTYDDSEDQNIKKVAHSHTFTSFFLLFILIVLFGFTLFNSLYYVGKYYKEKNNYQKGLETIEINDKKNTAIISNQGNIDKVLSANESEEEIVLTNISSIELSTNSDETELGKVKFNVKYIINQNDFKENISSKEDSDLRVRFAYSYDNKNWTYINNVISTFASTINPLLKNYYDISGLVTTLRVATNFELTSPPGKTTKMYWKSETTIKNRKDNINKGLKANFKIEYQESM